MRFRVEPGDNSTLRSVCFDDRQNFTTLITWCHLKLTYHFPAHKPLVLFNSIFLTIIDLHKYECTKLPFWLLPKVKLGLYCIHLVRQHCGHKLLPWVPDVQIYSKELHILV